MDKALQILQTLEEITEKDEEKATLAARIIYLVKNVFENSDLIVKEADGKEYGGMSALEGVNLFLEQAKAKLEEIVGIKMTFEDIILVEDIISSSPEE